MNLNMRRVINHSYSNKIDEVTRKNLVGKNKAQSPDRFKRKSSYHALSYNGIHLKELLERDLLVVEVPVGDYTCTLAYTGVLSELGTVLKSQPRPNVTLQSVIRALQRSIDNTDVLVDCTCADFCLHEDTQIKLLNGKVVSIKEMKSMFDNNEELWVYSTDNNGDFKPGKVSNVWISGTTTEYIEVTLDNDKIIKTTPNHLYMLRDGSYIRADELEQNMSLMPLYFSYHNGYENVKLNSIKDKTIFKSVYKIVSEEELAEQISIAKERSGEDIIQIHHSDFNKLNNYPSNLAPMGKYEHWMYHCSIAADHERFKKFRAAGLSYWRSDEGRKRKSIECSNSIKRYWKNMTPEQRQKRIEEMKKYSFFSNHNMSEYMRNIWNTMSDEEFKRRSKLQGKILNDAIKNMSDEERNNFYKRRGKSLSKFYSNNSKEATVKREQARQLGLQPKSIETRKAMSEAAKINWSLTSEEDKANRMKCLNNPEAQLKSKIGRYKYALMYIINNGLDLTEDNYNKYKRKSDPKVSTYFDSFESLINYFDLSLYNHKVKSINRISLDSPEFVYDLEVDNYHNFYVDAGVMLHNCYRFAYYATKYGYKYGTPETRPPKKTNPKDNLGATCKHLSALLYSKRWLVKLATSLNNLIKQYADDFRKAMKLQPNEFIINSSGRPSAKTGRNTGMLSNADNTDISNTNDSVVAANDDSIIDNAGGDEI